MLPATAVCGGMLYVLIVRHALNSAHTFSHVVYAFNARVLI